MPSCPREVHQLGMAHLEEISVAGDEGRLYCEYKKMGCEAERDNKKAVVGREVPREQNY